MENSKDCVFFMDIFYLKLFSGCWRCIFIVHSNWNFIIPFFIFLPKHHFFLSSSSNTYIYIYIFISKYRHMFEYTYELKISILLVLLEMTVF